MKTFDFQQIFFFAPKISFKFPVESQENHVKKLVILRYLGNPTSERC